MKYQDFIKNILSEKISPVYFFYGDENYLIDEGVGKIEKKYVTKNSASFNRDVFYGEESDASQIVITALSVPMLAPKRVVIVKNFQRLSQQGKERILKYSQRPSPQTVLVLISKTVDFRKKVYIGFKKYAELVECKSLYENQIPIYIQQFARDRGKSIHPRAIQLVQAKLGNSLQALINETEKLIHFVRDKNEITVEDVEELVGVSRDFNVFQLWDSIGQKNLTKSLLILKQMIETGESPVYLVSSLTSYFLRLWRIRALKKKNTPDNDVGKILHIHQFFVKSSIQQAKRYSDNEIRSIMKLLLKADIQLKTSYQKPKFVLELLIFQILMKKQAA
jgi:DNA polymerase III subunit delta